MGHSFLQGLEFQGESWSQRVAVAVSLWFSLDAECSGVSGSGDVVVNSQLENMEG